MLELKEEESMNIKFENFTDTLDGEDLFDKVKRVDKVLTGHSVPALKEK